MGVVLQDDWTIKTKRAGRVFRVSELGVSGSPRWGGSKKLRKFFVDPKFRAMVPCKMLENDTVYCGRRQANSVDLSSAPVRVEYCKYSDLH